MAARVSYASRENLIKCFVCQKNRQKSTFYAEHNPSGKKITCKYCSYDDKIYCPSCEGNHTRAEMLAVKFRVGEVCPLSISVDKSAVSVDSTEDDFLSIVASTMEILGSKIVRIENQNASITSKLNELIDAVRSVSIKTAPVPDYSEYEEQVSKLEAREREALESYASADDARKKLELRVAELEQDLAAKDALLSTINKGRSKILEVCRRISS